MSGLVFAVLLLGVVLPCGVLGEGVKNPPQPDRSLNQAGPVCIGRFYNITKTYYSKDVKCSYQVQQSFAAVSVGQCPTNGTDGGSPVQKCLGQSKATADAWTDFVRNCPVLNVKNRQSDAGRESTRYFSCFQDFNSVEDFRAYIDGTPTKSSARSSAAVVVPGIPIITLLMLLGLAMLGL